MEFEKNPVVNAILYCRPDGRKKDMDIRNVDKADADYIRENNINVSLEELNEETGDVAIYFDDGTLLDDDETPDEIVVLSMGKTCNQCMSEGVERLKKRKAA